MRISKSELKVHCKFYFNLDSCVVTGWWGRSLEALHRTISLALSRSLSRSLFSLSLFQLQPSIRAETVITVIALALALARLVAWLILARGSNGKLKCRASR